MAFQGLQGHVWTAITFGAYLPALCFGRVEVTEVRYTESVCS
jgi:hypothetical protein